MNPSIMNSLHFLRPNWFVLLPLIAVLLWLYQRRKVSSRSWKAACDPELLSHLLVGGSEGEAGRKGLYLLGAAAVLATFALAGPVWKQLETPVFRDESALVIILDLSRSMDATDVKPTRLSRARHKLIDILKDRKEGQTALVIYAGGAFVVSPLTQDAKTIISQVSALKTTLIPRQGSRPGLAISKAVQLLKQAGVPKGEVLLITDGLENVLKDALAMSHAKLLTAGHRLSILGVGTLEGAPIKLEKGGYFRDSQDRLVIPKLDEAGLSAMAQKGGGRYSRITSDESDIDTLFSESALRGLQGLEDTQKDTGLKTDRWREEGPWLLLCLLPFAALAFRRGILAIPFFLLVLSLPQSVHAIDWDTLWSRPDQRAQDILEQGEESAAASLFEDPEWKSAAHYRSGNYQKSLEALEGIQNPEALYNKGNALAHLGKLPEALSAYDEALKLDPDHEDAAYNKEQVEAQLSEEDQNQNQQGEGESSEDSDDSEDSEESEESGEQDEEGEDSEPSEQDQEDDQEQNQEGEDQDSESEQENQQESDSPEQNDGESEQETQETETEEQDESDAEENQAVKSDKQDELDETDEQKETQLALEQWLRRIPDDPGGLLRRKFLYQSQQQRPTINREEAPW